MYLFLNFTRRGLFRSLVDPQEIKVDVYATRIYRNNLATCTGIVRAFLFLLQNKKEVLTRFGRNHCIILFIRNRRSYFNSGDVVPGRNALKRKN